MNGIFKVVVVAVMAALFAAGHTGRGRDGSFQGASADLIQSLVRLH